MKDTRKKALVTGGAKRIGREICLFLAEQGFDVCIHYRESEAEAESLQGELEERGTSAFLVQGDLFQDEDVLSICQQILKDSCGLDLLVNNASYYPEPQKLQAAGGFLVESMDEWERALRVNAKAPFFLMQQLYPLLSKSNDGHVVNILDACIETPFLSRASYSVSKSALEAITKLGAKSFRGKVRVNGLVLGPTLPGELMSEEEMGRRRWSGVKKVLESLENLMKDPTVNGLIQPV